MTQELHGENISYAVDGADILRNVNCHLQKGEVLALLGPNGAGKTTLLRVLLGLLLPQSGRVRFAAQPLKDEQQRAKTLAYVPQRGHLAAQLSAWDMVALGRFPHRGNRLGLRTHDRRCVDEALHACDCQHLASRPYGQCSGGEQARLLVARALATEAPMLLLDEPAASLDIAHRLQLYALLQNLAKEGKGVLIVMHQIEDAQHFSDRVLLMNQGHIIADGKPSEVLTADIIRTVYGVDMVERAAASFHLSEGEG